DIERPDQAFFQADEPVVFLVKIFRMVAGNPAGYVPDPAFGRVFAAAEGLHDEEGLEDGAGASRCLDEVHEGRVLAADARDVADVGDDLLAAVVDDDGGSVVDALSAQVLVVARHVSAETFLELGADGAVVTAGPVAAAQGLAELGGRVRQLKGPLGDILAEGQSQAGTVDCTAFGQAAQQGVALRQEQGTVFPGKNEAGSIGQNGKGGGLGPTEQLGRFPKIAPRRRLDTDDVAAKWSRRRILTQDLRLAVTQLVAQGHPGLRPLAAIVAQPRA